MPNPRDTIGEKTNTVLVKAATTIGRAAGKLIGLVSRKSAEDPVRKTRAVSQTKRQTSAAKRAASKKTGRSRKQKGTVKSRSRPRKTSRREKEE